MFNTIHIFGYGETQIIGEDLNVKVDSSLLTTLTSFVNHVKNLRPEDVIESEYHVIHVFNGANVRYLSHSDNKDEKKTFFVNFDQVDLELLNALVAELTSYQPA
jgi:cell division FtsZ-interacting protein ZapD